MSTKSREVIWGGQIMGAEIHARVPGRPTRRKRPARRIVPRPMHGQFAWRATAARHSPRQRSRNASMEAWAGLRWNVIAARRASLPLDAIRRPRDTPIWKLEASLKCRSCRKGRHAPPIRMIKLTAAREITPYKWVHPDEER